jgi:hypothetical protein
MLRQVARQLSATSNLLNQKGGKDDEKNFCFFIGPIGFDDPWSGTRRTSAGTLQ